jgi:hypothetical protein
MLMVGLSFGCFGVINPAAQVHLPIVHEATETDGRRFFCSAEGFLMRGKPTDLRLCNDTGR